MYSQGLRPNTQTEKYRFCIKLWLQSFSSLKRKFKEFRDLNRETQALELGNGAPGRT